MEELPFFVYGTLRHGQKNYRLLRSKTISEVPASIHNAALYALRHYPMLMEGNGIVYGELMTLSSAIYSQLVKQLDDFEGYTLSDNYLFRRVRGTVRLDSGEQISAWLYMGNPQYLSQVSHTLIEYGDWCRYLQERVNA